MSRSIPRTAWWRSAGKGVNVKPLPDTRARLAATLVFDPETGDETGNVNTYEGVVTT
jgi:hypothetical protein